MIRNLLYSFILFYTLFSTDTLFAQKQKINEPAVCRDPKLPIEVIREIEAVKKSASAKLTIPANKPASSAWKQEEIIIPLVVHVYGTHHNGREVTAEIVKDAIKRTNEDFKGQTADWSDGSLSALFDDKKEKLNITFELARLDPDGNPTTGILFHQNEVGFGEDVGYDNDIRKYAWDNYKYCNLYIQNDFYAERDQSGYHYNSGVAWLPSKYMSDQNTSRVVYNGAYLGDNAGKNAYGENFRSILTHEFGHWLDLNHTFYGGCSTELSHVGDAVDDTPPVNNNTNKPGETLNCRGEYINWQNFMDYTTQYAMFTEDQVAKMLDALDHVARVSLWQEENLIATGVKEANAPIAKIKGEKYYGLTLGESITLEDVSTSLPTSFQWDLYLGNSSDGILVITGNEKTFTHAFNTLGDHMIVLTAGNSIGSSQDTVSLKVFNTLPDLAVAKIKEGDSILLNINSNHRFESISTGTIDSLKWGLYEGTSVSGNLISKGKSADFNHIFDKTGTYTVALSVRNKRGVHTSTQKVKVYEVVSDFSVANIKACDSEIVVNYRANVSEGVDTFNWTFEGGTPSTSTEKKPSVTYYKSGNYAVSLRVGRSDVPETDQKELNIPINGNKRAIESLSFESENALEFWEINNPDNGLKWELDNRSGYVGTTSLVMNNADNRNIGEIDMITSPTFDFTNVEEMSFFVAYTMYDQDSPDVLELEFSDDCGSSWTSVFKKTHTELETRYITTGNSNAWIPSAENEWRKEVLDISDFKGKNNVQFRFKNISGFGTRVWIDHIEFKQANPMTPVANFTASPEVINDEISITAGTGVTFTDTSTNYPTSWSWKVADSEEGTASEFTHTFANEGTYTLELTATNSAGNSTKSVTVKVSPIEYTITVNQPANGSISPETLSVVEGTDQGFTFTPALDHELKSILVDGDSVANTSPYTLSDIQKAQTVSAVFTKTIVAPVKHRITVNQPANGSISPETLSVVEGTDQEFTFTPALDHELKSILVDGDSVANTSPYTLSGIQKAQTVSAVFTKTIVAPVKHRITVNQPANGSISPETLSVVEGTDQGFTFTPALDHELKSILVDGDSVANTSPYTLSDIQKAQTVSAVFTKTIVAPVKHRITVNQPANGSISPETLSVVEGTDQGFTFTPALDHELKSILVDGDSVANTSPYTLSDIQKAQTVSAVFTKTIVAPVKHRITVNQPANGSISPETLSVVEGTDQEFTFTPALDHELKSILVDGDSVANTSPYTLSDIQKAQTVSAVFTKTIVAPVKHRITVNQSANGSISPETLSVVEGTDQEFTFTPALDHELKSILVDGDSVSNTSPYILSNIQKAQTVSAVFTKTIVAPVKHRITVNQPANGSISPETLSVVEGTDQEFTFTPALDHELKSILVDGDSVANTSPYTLSDIQKAQTVSAVFTKTIVAPVKHRITVNQPANGSISPETLSVVEGTDQEFTFTPALDHELKSILVDGDSVANTSPYTLSGIQKAQTVSAVFTKIVVLPENQILVILPISDIEVGEIVQVTVSGNETSLTYGSSDRSIATVDENGLVTAVASGSAIVTVNAAGNEAYHAASAATTIVVNTPAKQNQTLTILAVPNLETGTTTSLQITGAMTTLTYTSSDESVATVDANGLITAIAEGNATITVNAEASAEYKEASGTVDITVNRNVLAFDTDLDFVLNAYPNPSTGVFKLNLPKSFKKGSVDVITALGTVFRNFEIKDRNQTFNLQGLNAGIYYLKVTLDGRASVLKLTLR